MRDVAAELAHVPHPSCLSSVLQQANPQLHPRAAVAFYCDRNSQPSHAVDTSDLDG